MQRLGTVIAAIAMAGCAAPVASGPAPIVAGLQGASFERKSWGRLVERWRFTAPDQVEYEKVRSPFKADSLIDVHHTRLTPRQVVQLQAAILSADRVAQRPKGCDRGSTDAPYGTLGWTIDGEPGLIKWDGNCIRGRDNDLLVEVIDADRLVSDVARATPPVEQRPAPAYR